MATPSRPPRVIVPAWFSVICYNRLINLHKVVVARNQVSLSIINEWLIGIFTQRNIRFIANQNRVQTCKVLFLCPHSEKFKMNRNGNSILSENICDLLLVWNVFSILFHYKCSGFFIRIGFPFLSGIKLWKKRIPFWSKIQNDFVLIKNAFPFV